MGMTLDVLEVKLAQLDYYPSLFEAAFGSDQITSERIGQALAQFVRAMVSYQSKYDMALSTTNNPDDLSHVLNATEEAGRRLFELPPPEGGFGCAGCHGTVAQVTDRAFNIGLDVNTPDEGAGNGEFKVPSLRNIEVGAPYMHDGRFATLAEVIEHYNSGVQDHPNLAQQLRHPANNQPVRLNMSNTEKTQLEAFLNTLTDDVLLTSELFSDPFK
jgi:cytochrome c peroxidase